MFGLTWDQVKGPFQTILAFIGGFIVSRGYLTAEAVTGIVGGVVTIVGAIWVAKSSTQVSIVSAAINLPNVDRVVTSNTVEGRELAANTPSGVGPAPLVTSPPPPRVGP